MSNTRPVRIVRRNGTSRSTKMLAYAAIALASLVAAACGDDADPVTTGASSDDRAAVTIRLSNYAFQDVPRTITSGTAIAVTNQSANEAHELTAWRLPDGETRSLAELQLLPPDELGALISGAPVLAIAARPNADGELFLGDGTLREPGRYLLICFIPTGADPDQVMTAMSAAASDPAAGPPQIEGGPPHMAAGMIAEIGVTP